MVGSHGSKSVRRWPDPVQGQKAEDGECWD